MKQDCDQAHFPFSTIPYDTNSSFSYPTLQQEQELDESSRVCKTQEPPISWMSSKMRLMRKMMMGEDHRTVGSNQAQQNHQYCHSNNTIIRVCSNCSTTKTPLWRGGPQGPKSLCNACGIRQMKARRALRATAAAASGGVVPDRTTAHRKATKKERTEVDRTVPFKKRFKIPSATIGSSKKLAFPQEEKDAAILLMALSCGLIHV